MKSRYTLGYLDLFPSPVPEIQELLVGISSQTVIHILSQINCELGSSDDIDSVQIRITNFVLEGIAPVDAGYLSYALACHERESLARPIVWAKRYLKEFLQFECLHYRDCATAFSTEESLMRVFKAYLIFAQQTSAQEMSFLNQETDASEGVDSLSRERFVWPYCVRQFDNNNSIDPGFQFFRLIAFLKFAKSDHYLRSAWKEYIRANGFSAHDQYLLMLQRIIISSARERANSKYFHKVAMLRFQQSSKFVISLSLNPKTLKPVKKGTSDFKSLRQFPLFSMQNNQFAIMDADYLMNKIYNGPLFDLYYEGQLGNHPNFRDFGVYKSYISKNLAENIIFKGLLAGINRTTEVVIHFDDSASDGQPDCYVRDGNNIFLFEFKDALFPGAIVEQFSFDEIKKDVDRKFVCSADGKRKGVLQLAQHLKTLANGGFDFDPISELTEEISIYPILIHTEFMYQIPGVNKYLADIYRLAVLHQPVNTALKSCDVVMIDLSLFYEFVQLASFTFSSLQECILQYEAELILRASRFLDSPSFDTYCYANISFDELYRSTKANFNNELPPKSRLEKLKQCLNLDATDLEYFSEILAT